jgi:transposase-like protein
VADYNANETARRLDVHANTLAYRLRWCAEGASRPRVRAHSTASARLCAPSLAYRLRRWVLTVLVETDSSVATSGADK